MSAFNKYNEERGEIAFTHAYAATQNENNQEEIFEQALEANLYITYGDLKEEIMDGQGYKLVSPQEFFEVYPEAKEG